MLVFGNFPEGYLREFSNHDFRKCSDSNSEITSALEIANSGANLVSDRKVDFSRNLGCALADFYGHYSSRDLQFHIANTAAFRRLVNTGMDDAQSHFPSGSTYRWAMWTGDISNMFDEINHAEILTVVTWAISSAGGWSGKRIVDLFSVARFGKGARIGVDYTDEEIVTFSTSQLFDICKFDLMHLYVNARHQYYKRGQPYVNST